MKKETIWHDEAVKAKISKITGSPSEKMFQKQKVYILYNINNIKLPTFHQLLILKIQKPLYEINHKK